jgi:hypothetical protein
MYRTGNGVPKDYKTALKWYRIATERGNAGSAITLGLMYNNGDGVPKDYKEAEKWFRLAAEQGNISAQFNLGKMYHFGDGVQQDFVYAHMWWSIVASSGDKDAVTLRDAVSKRMTPADISKAQDLARECVRKKYKGC